MKRPLAYITAAWYGGDTENAELAAQYCRAVYDAGFAPTCPALFLPIFLNDAVPEEIQNHLHRVPARPPPPPVLVARGHPVPHTINNSTAPPLRTRRSPPTPHRLLHVNALPRTPTCV